MSAVRAGQSDLALQRRPSLRQNDDERAQWLIAISYFLLAGYVAAESLRDFSAGHHCG